MQTITNCLKLLYIIHQNKTFKFEKIQSVIQVFDTQLFLDETKIVKIYDQ